MVTSPLNSNIRSFLSTYIDHLAKCRNHYISTLKRFALWYIDLSLPRPSRRPHDLFLIEIAMNFLSKEGCKIRDHSPYAHALKGWDGVHLNKTQRAAWNHFDDKTRYCRNLNLGAVKLAGLP